MDKSMAYVYILQSENNGKYYIGSTNDLEKRVKKHKEGGVRFTSGILPVKLVYRKIQRSYIYLS